MPAAKMQPIRIDLGMQMIVTSHESYSNSQCTKTSRPTQAKTAFLHFYLRLPARVPISLRCKGDAARRSIQEQPGPVLNRHELHFAFRLALLGEPFASGLGAHGFQPYTDTCMFTP